MSGSTRTLQVTLGIGQIAAAIVAVALAVVLAGVVAFGPLTSTKPQTAPAEHGPQILIDEGSGSSGSHGTRFAH
jgi:hypothetical protein